MLPRSLSSLLRQDYPGPLSIIVVDDQSEDGTASVARALGVSARRRVEIISGEPLPPGWTGKVWAMQQGIAHAESASPPPGYVLFTDADIDYSPEVLGRLVARAANSHLVLTSIMAKLNCESLAERALVPAFVLFFQMLYPFAWVNRPRARTAAAAGGCMLVERRALQRAGGIGAIRGALIDDCALGNVMKRQGPIWLGLSDDVRSLRPYPHLRDIHAMVARSAYAQLGYSPALLIGTIAGMGLTFLAPPILAILAPYPASLLAMGAWALMLLAYQPMLRVYRLSPLWALALPLTAAMYLLFTVDSALQHWQGRGGMWKGRAQALRGEDGKRGPVELA